MIEEQHNLPPDPDNLPLTPEDIASRGEHATTRMIPPARNTENDLSEVLNRDPMLQTQEELLQGRTLEEQEALLTQRDEILEGREDLQTISDDEPVEENREEAESIVNDFTTQIRNARHADQTTEEGQKVLKNTNDMLESLITGDNERAEQLRKISPGWYKVLVGLGILYFLTMGAVYMGSSMVEQAAGGKK